MLEVFHISFIYIHSIVIRIKMHDFHMHYMCVISVAKAISIQDSRITISVVKTESGVDPNRPLDTGPTSQSEGRKNQHF